jgi:diguanylate cyclase (GGDEF)-like protein
VALLTGTFGKDNPDILQQEKNIEVLYKEVQLLLDELEQSPVENLGFQTHSSLQQMRRASSAWYENYLQVKTIYGTEHWRSDVPFLNTRIQPYHERIQRQLEYIEKLIDQDSNTNFTDLNIVSSSIIVTFWLLIGVALVFIITGYVVLSGTILRPIANITSALRREAFFDGTPIIPRVSTKETRELVDAFHELHSQVQSRQYALEHQALHDALTGLPNRILLQDRLQQAIDNAKREGASCALFVTDLDRFKEINDTLGHHIGDRILMETSLRLHELLRHNDTIARLGGDEFALVLPTADTQDALRIAEKITTSFDKAITIDNHHLYVGISVGIALYPEHGDDTQSLLQRADIAMYSAKRSNSGYAVYESDQDPTSLNRLRLVNDLRLAIQNNALELHYQPIISLHNREVVGAEALLRWRHPEFGMVPPNDSIQLAEHTGLIRPLTSWVISTALKDYNELAAKGFDTGLSINLSAWNLQDIDLFDYIKSSLASFSMQPDKLHLEITESVMMTDVAHASSNLRAFEKLGVHLSIDDFGTGFSSLAYLKQLPVSQLKIDKSFVLDMADDENDAAIVHSIIDLAQNLGLTVTAEGVESEAVLDMLVAMSCDLVQGYFICKPLPFDEFKKWLNMHY